MKSEKAFELINNRAKSLEECLNSATKIGRIVVPVVTAFNAIELAEEEMIEKASQAFAESCEMYAGNGKCLEGGKCENCKRVKDFVIKMI